MSNDVEYYNRIFVVSKNREQAMFHTHRSELFIYVDEDYHQLRGVRDFIIMFVGEWDRRKGLRELEDYLRSFENVIKIYR